MATNSAATRKANRDGHGYRTGVSKANGAARCDTCVHVAPTSSHVQQSKYDRICSVHVAPCKTHGHCRRHQPQQTQAAAEAEARTNNCPICEARISPDRLMCLKHWSLVPADMKRRVWAAWRALTGSVSQMGGRTARAMTARNYDRARADAIAAVRLALGPQQEGANR